MWYINRGQITPYPAITCPVWVKGFNTSGLVDGNVIRTKRAFKVTGTKTYDTADGSKTIFVLEPITMRDNPLEQGDKRY
jgi:hypothetical protein